MEGLDREVSQVTTKLPKAANNVQKFGNQAKKTSSQVDNLAKSIRGVLTAAALFQTAKFVIVKTAELETQTKSLEVLTGSLEEAESVISRLQKFANVTPFSSSELIDTAKRLKAFGVDTEKLVDTTQRLADVSGATGARLQEVALAYGQVQAKGRLQGEELLQLQERGIALQDELKKMYNLTGEEFSDAMRKGQISAKAVEVAVVRLTEKGGKYADGAIAQSDTLAGKFSTLVDGIDNIARTLGQVLAPVLKGVLDLAIQTVNAINDVFAAGKRGEFARGRASLVTPGSTNTDLERLTQSTKSVVGDGLGKDQIDSLISGITKNQEVAREVAAAINKSRPFGVTDKEIQNFETLQRESQAAIERLQEARKTAAEVGSAANIEIPKLTTGPGGGSGGGSASSNALDVTRELEKQQRIRENIVDSALSETAAFADQLRSLEDQKQILEGKLNGTEREARLAIQIRDATEGLPAPMAAFVEERLRSLDALEQEVEKQGELNNELTQGQQMLADSYNIIAGNLTSGIQGLIDGTKEWGDILSNILGQLGSMFLNAGFNGLGVGLGILPARAAGGPVTGQQPYMVGEQGPELFVPNNSGQIINNEALQRYNPSNSNDSSGSKTIRFQSTIINSVEYVTRDQAVAMSQEAANDGAKRGAAAGHARSMSTLKNSRGQRQKLGMSQ